MTASELIAILSALPGDALVVVEWHPAEVGGRALAEDVEVLEWGPEEDEKAVLIS